MRRSIHSINANNRFGSADRFTVWSNMYRIGSFREEFKEGKFNVCLYLRGSYVQTTAGEQFIKSGGWAVRFQKMDLETGRQFDSPEFPGIEIREPHEETIVHMLISLLLFPSMRALERILAHPDRATSSYRDIDIAETVLICRFSSYLPTRVKNIFNAMWEISKPRFEAKRRKKQEAWEADAREEEARLYAVRGW